MRECTIRARFRVIVGVVDVDNITPLPARGAFFGIKDEDNQSTTTNDDVIPEEEESCFAGVVLRTRRVSTISALSENEAKETEKKGMCCVLF